MRIEETTQQRVQRVGGERLRTQCLLHLQVQPRHVDAALVRPVEVDEGADPRAGALHLAIAGIEQHRHLDIGHADPIQRTGKVRLRVHGNIGQQAGGVFLVRHGGSPGIGERIAAKHVNLGACRPSLQ